MYTLQPFWRWIINFEVLRTQRGSSSLRVHQYMCWFLRKATVMHNFFHIGIVTCFPACIPESHAWRYCNLARINGFHSMKQFTTMNEMSLQDGLLYKIVYKLKCIPKLSGSMVACRGHSWISSLVYAWFSIVLAETELWVGSICVKAQCPYHISHVA